MRDTGPHFAFTVVTAFNCTCSLAHCSPCFIHVTCRLAKHRIQTQDFPETTNTVYVHDQIYHVGQGDSPLFSVVCVGIAAVAAVAIWTAA